MTKNRKQWILFTFLLIIGLAIGLYLAIRQISEVDVDEAVLSTEGTVGANSAPTVQTSKVSNGDLIQSSSVSQNNQAGNYDAMKFLDSDETKRSVYRSLCGTKSFDFEKMLGVSPDDLQFSAEQLSAAEEITKKCQLWIDGIDSGRWNDSEHEVDKSELELYQLMSLVDSSTENIAIAKELLISKDYSIALEAAQILIAYDQGFQKLVANSTGSETSSYAENAAREIIPLLSCRLAGDCGPNSVSMLTICLGNGNGCGESMLSYLRKYHSFMYLEDVNTMTEEIYRMITGDG